jgi:hypothetical protein
MTRIKELHKKWMGDAEYRQEYEALKEEFALASTMIRARKRAGLNLNPAKASKRAGD